jgi:hypothetical protein
MGARSAGCSTACNDFILTACVHNMTWGGPGTLQSGRVWRDDGQGHIARIWEEDDSVLSID